MLRHQTRLTVAAREYEMMRHVPRLKDASLTVLPQIHVDFLLPPSNQNHLVSTFATGLPYAEPVSGNEFHGGELGIQGSRSAESLKLWIGLRQLGEKGIEKILLDSINRRTYLESMIDPLKYKTISGPLHLLALTPINCSTAQASDWSIKTRNSLLKNKFMLSRPFYKNRYYLKVVLGNPNTNFDDLKHLANLINDSII